MLVLIIYFTILTHRSFGSDDLTELLKTYPTWSFELESVDSFIKNAAGSVKDANPLVTEEMLRAKLSRNLDPGRTHIVKKVGDPKWIKDLPRHFDAREEWKDCAELISNIEDEGSCNTDSPAVVASVMADRYCIFTNGTVKKTLSQEILTGCAESCTQEQDIGETWRYAKLIGIPTGGPQGSKEGCLPSEQAPCLHGDSSFSTAKRHGLRKLKPCSEDMTYDHDCPTKCSNPKYPISFEQDLLKCKIYYKVSGHEFCIRNEIFLYGPVVTRITLHNDFYQRPDGVYNVKKDSKYVGRSKYLKLIGWGEENGVKYWLAVNTWDQWGDKVFKIPRGVNYIGVEAIPSTAVFNDFQ